MDHIPQMTDLAFTDEEKAEKAKEWGPCEGEETPKYRGPDYPYRMTFMLTERELCLTGLDEAGIAVGDMLHGHFFAKVTSISSEDCDGKEYRSVTLQITHLSAEDEAEEDKESEDEIDARKERMLSRY